MDSNAYNSKFKRITSHVKTIHQLDIDTGSGNDTDYNENCHNNTIHWSNLTYKTIKIDVSKTQVAIRQN
jgi:hypothetical protein